MKQEDFELEAKDAAKAMLKKKAPTRPETHDVKDDPLGEYFEGIR